MTQLLHRVGSRPSAGTIVPLPRHIEANVRPARPELAQPEPDDLSLAETRPFEPGEFMPRTVAPEAGSNLQVLRDVANTSARSAIDQHTRRGMERSATILWFVGIVALMVGGTLAAWSESLFTVPAFAALAAFLVSAFCMLRGVTLAASAKLAVGRAPQHGPPSDRQTDSPRRDDTALHFDSEAAETNVN
jgi:hypothetical protein